METDRSVMATEDHKNGGSGANGQRNDRDRNGGYNRGSEVMAMLRIVRVVTDLLQVMTAPNRGDGRPQNRFGKNQPGKGYVRKHR